MPLVLGYCWYVHKYVVAGVKVEVRWSLYYQVGDFGRQQQTRTDIRFTVFGAHQRETVKTFAQVQQSGNYKPFPEVRTVEDQQQVKRHVQQMSPIEYLRKSKRERQK